MDKQNKKKILIVTGTRAEYGLLRSTIRAMTKSAVLEPSILATGMHFLKAHGRTIDDIYADNWRIGAKKVFVKEVPVSEGDSMVGMLVKELKGIETYCASHRPDVILVLGDRDEAFAGAVVGAHLGVPIAHIHGGDSTGGVVDDGLRHAISKFSHVHFTICAKSSRAVQKLGEEPWRIHMVGAPGLDGLITDRFKTKAELSKEFNLDPREPWIIVLQHPAPLDSTPIAGQITPTLAAVKKVRGQKIAIYPNRDTGSNKIIHELVRFTKDPAWKLFPHLRRGDYLSFFKCADVLVGNSSSGIIESTFFHLPTINIGKRQEGRERGKNVIQVNYNEAQISKALTLAMSSRFYKIARAATHPYGKGGAGKKIVAALEKEIFNPRLTHKNYVT